MLRGTDDTNSAFIVDFATTDLTATKGLDYTGITNTLSFAPGEKVKLVTVPILNDGVKESSKNFRVTLSNPTGGATLGTASTTVNILDASGLTSRTVAPPFDTALTIRREGGLNLITWSGGGQLQRADRPMGPWQTLTTATNPFTVQSPLPTTFYRVPRPRPVNVYIPSSYDGQTPLPLVILLHAYTSAGADHEAYMRFSPLAQARGFLYCYPDSTIDILGTPFWNATDACCDFYNSGVDDAGYLRALIEEIGSQFSVDRKRIYLIGHSNGGFMAYRMACQYADLIAGIASLAGMTFLDPSRCQPSHPVNILHIHGTADDQARYLGNAFQPGALQSVQFWAGYNGAADPIADPLPSMNLDLVVPGLDTVITRYTNAPPGGAAELWTINGGGHEPTFYSGSSASEFAPRVIDWLLTHPKP